MPTETLADTSPVSPDDITTCPHADKTTGREGGMPIIEIVHTRGYRPVQASSYGTGHTSTWPQAYTATRPHGYNPYMSPYPRRPR